MLVPKEPAAPVVEDAAEAGEAADVMGALPDLPDNEYHDFGPRESGASNNLSNLDAEDFVQTMSRKSQRSKGADGSQGVFIRDEDYKAMLRNVGRKEDTKSQYKKLAKLLLLFGAMMAVIGFLTTYTTVELSKETHVKNGAITDSSGAVVKTKSADVEVCTDGSLVKVGGCAPADSTGGMSKDGKEQPKDTTSVLTINSKKRQALSSSLSDSVFMSLNEIAVFSDKGHTLRLQIAGFSRVPVLNSRCGNVVHLYTAWNGRLTLDSTDLSFDPATEAAFENAGFSLAVGGMGGRRLAEDHSVDGFFSAVQGVEESGQWTCQDVPLPTLPDFYSQKITVYRPCAVEGVTGQSLDMCDSRYGGVVPGVAPLSRELQLATMTKTERVRAKLSVDVAIEKTLFVATEIETIKSPGYELQVTNYANHPGQQKVHLFDRSTASDISFQLITGKQADGRFFCNSSGSSEVTPQKKDLEAQTSGVDRKLHFELLDLVEENGKVLRHFRMLPAEAFMEWMGGKAASDRPKDAYYEYWDVAADMSPYRLLNPDGSLVVFHSSSSEGATDVQVEARLADLGAAGWASRMVCTDQEKKITETTSVSLGMEVPMMVSPMMDLNKEALMFYAKLNLDQNAEDATGNGWETIAKRAAAGDGPTAQFSKYALRSTSDLAMPDLCADACASNLKVLQAELEADSDLDLCNASSLGALTTCLVDIAAALTPLCLKNNLMFTVNSECLADSSGSRRLSDSHAIEDVSLDGSEEYLRRLGAIQDEHLGKYQKSGETKQSQMSRVKDGSYAINLSTLDVAQKEKLAHALGVKSLSTGRVVFNATDHLPEQKVSAMLEATEDEAVHSRRLMLDMKCLAPGVGPGCIFSIGYPWGCDPIGGSPKCKFGLAVKVQTGGPAAGALSVGGSGCIEEWAFGVPKPFSGSVCVDGGIGVSWNSWCGLPFSLSGQVGITASVGLDLVIFSFTAASIRIEAGAAMEKYKYNCDDRRRRRRWIGGRRRGSDTECQEGCDIKVYAKGTLTILFGRLWALAQYWFKNRDFDFILGADIYIWAVFTGWWETVGKVQIV